MGKSIRIFLLFSIFFLGLARLSLADSLTAPLEQLRLPNSEWTWGKPDKDASTSRILYPTKVGQAVNLRVHTYGVEVTARDFLDEVRGRLMVREDYKGAEVRLIMPRKVGDISWDVFEVKRKDQISQEVWGRKPSPGVVLMLIYTGAGSYFQEYYGQFQNFLEGISKN